MASNGTISDKTKFSLGLVLIIIGIVGTVGGFAYNVQSGMAVHCASVDVHHTTAQLDADYTRKDLSDQRFAEIIRRLDRIEQKLDK